MHARDVPPVPAGSRVLQIGPFKTGTTAIQHAASSRRTELAAHGVVYPGTGLNHRWGCSALVGFTWGWTRAEAEAAAPKHGRTLLEEISRAPKDARIWLSYERLAVLEEDRARALCDLIGGPLHVVIGLRPLRSLLPSEWQQLIKSGRRPGELEEWAQHCLTAVDDGRARARHLDHAGLVERWAGIVGADSVTCIAVDPQTPDALPRATEALFGLPEGLLAPPATGVQRNRALTAAELALVAAVARELRDRGLTREDYLELVGRGVIPQLLARHPDPTEARVRLGEGAAARAHELDQRSAERVRRAGVRVIGDLDRYAGTTTDGRPRSTPEPIDVPDLVPVDIAAAAVLGVAEQLQAARSRSVAATAMRSVRGSLRRRVRRRAATAHG